MANHPNRAGKFELVYEGGQKRRYRRWHKTFDAALAEAQRVGYQMQHAGTNIMHDGDNICAHRAIVYGPDCGREGRVVVGG